MRVCMVTPHLPPEQAANALLPVVLAEELRRTGVEVSLVAHPAPRTASSAGERHVASRGREPSGALLGADVVYVPRRGRHRLARSPLGALAAAARMAMAMHRALARADVVHLHSNGLIIEVAGVLARRRRVPYIVTLYGTDVWHHDPVRHRRFAAVVRRAAHRVCYSRALLTHAQGVGLADEPASVIYAPVSPAFQPASDEVRRAIRQSLGVENGTLLVTVKRLHPVAGHEDLLRALPTIARARPDVSLILLGEGSRRPTLEALARDLGVAARVRFLGLVPNDAVVQYVAAADLFVLPSRLESWGTVMLEALACGTRVVATDTAGALEVRSWFPDDVVVCPRENPEALAAAVVGALDTRHGVAEATRRALAERFTPAACASAYRDLYERALERRTERRAVT